MANYNDQMMQQAGMRPVALEIGSVRSAFMAKVYAVFTAGLLIASTTCYLAQVSPAVLGLGLAIFRNFWIYLLLVFGLNLGMNAVRHVPVLNMVAFVIYTIFYGLIGAPLIYVVAHDAGGPLVVLQAAGLTALVFGGLTIWALTTKDDLSNWGIALVVGALLMVGVAVIGVLTHGGLGLWYAALWVVLLAGFTMYDTWMIQRKYPTTEWMMGGIALFVDFWIMFLYIVQLLAGGRRR